MALLSNQDATSEIRRIALNSENIIFCEHAREQMQKRQIDDIDVLKCLTNGVVKDIPERKNENSPYRYRMENRSGKRSYSVVVEIELVDELLVITTF